MAHTPGLWKHKRRPIQFSLIVDNFGVKYVGKEHIDYLIQSLKKHYGKTTIDWARTLYAGITLNWNYQERWVDASMPGYVEKLKARFGHKQTSRDKNSPYQAPSKVFGAKVQAPIEEDK